MYVYIYIYIHFYSLISESLKFRRSQNLELFGLSKIFKIIKNIGQRNYQSELDSNIFRKLFLFFQSLIHLPTLKYSQCFIRIFKIYLILYTSDTSYINKYL